MITLIISSTMKRIVRNPPEPLRLLILMISVLLYGTSGFLYFELPGNPDLSWGDGLWYTIVTIATVGYGDFFPKTLGGRFLIGWPIMIFGIGLLGYALSLVAAALVTSKSREIKGMSAFNLNNHLVIFNYPGLGKIQRVLEELLLDPLFDRHKQIVLIDEELEELPQALQKQGLHYVRGNPARDETLTRASLDRAAYAMVLSKIPGDPLSDNLNIAITLAIEARCRSVQTVVECADPASEELLHKAGSDRVVCSASFDSLFISQELLNPGAQGIIADLFSAKGGQQIYFTPLSQPELFSELSKRCHRQGHMAIGVKTGQGVRLNLSDNFKIEASDQVITIGATRPKAF